LGMTVTNQNLIQEEIKRRLNSGNACYHAVRCLLICCLKTKFSESVLPSRPLATSASSGSAIPGFSRHITKLLCMRG
jgi:hypothetical protein